MENEVSKMVWLRCQLPNTDTRPTKQEKKVFLLPQHQMPHTSLDGSLRSLESRRGLSHDLSDPRKPAQGERPDRFQTQPAS